jgi:hypothetical protein
MKKRKKRGRATSRKLHGLEITLKYSSMSEEEAVLRLLEQIKSKFPRVSVRRV